MEDLKEQNLMEAQNYNRSTKHQDSTKTAIAYTRCYTLFFPLCT